MDLLAERVAKQPLTPEVMREVMERLVSGAMPPEEIRAFLQGLASRGETAEEIAAATEVLRAHAVKLPLSRPLELCDTCGTGGDGQGTVNISTLAALVASAAGVRVVKHGNRAASSRCGSADLLEALGVNLLASPAQVVRCLDEVGFGFCFAPQFHPAMRVVAPVRKALGIRTIFNLVGPLANPAPLAFQLVGVSEARWLRPMAEALVKLGVRHGLVVHGEDGLDEVTTTGPTAILEVRAAGAITEGRLDPATLGLPRATLDALRGGDAQHNARMARACLAGAPSAIQDVVVLNAGCAIYVADQARTIQEGLAKAREALVSGRTAQVLERVRELTHAG
ncbi:MAG: anthranilate phosphoribosyltransferase [Candidatus Omnitrophota bacterium]|nr:anthranilate phosphoribosyltransferase [Candidatus Omnitrophota bacterium]